MEKKINFDEKSILYDKRAFDDMIRNAKLMDGEPYCLVFSDSIDDGIAVRWHKENSSIDFYRTGSMSITGGNKNKEWEHKIFSRILLGMDENPYKIFLEDLYKEFPDLEKAMSKEKVIDEKEMKEPEIKEEKSIRNTESREKENKPEEKEQEDDKGKEGLSLEENTLDETEHNKEDKTTEQPKTIIEEVKEDIAKNKTIKDGAKSILQAFKNFFSSIGDGIATLWARITLGKEVFAREYEKAAARTEAIRLKEAAKERTEDVKSFNDEIGERESNKTEEITKEKDISENKEEQLSEPGHELKKAVNIEDRDRETAKHIEPAFMFYTEKTKNDVLNPEKVTRTGRHMFFRDQMIKPDPAYIKAVSEMLAEKMRIDVGNINVEAGHTNTERGMLASINVTITGKDGKELTSFGINSAYNIVRITDNKIISEKDDKTSIALRSGKLILEHYGKEWRKGDMPTTVPSMNLFSKTIENAVEKALPNDDFVNLHISCANIYIARENIENKETYSLMLNDKVMARNLDKDEILSGDFLTDVRTQLGHELQQALTVNKNEIQRDGFYSRMSPEQEHILDEIRTDIEPEQTMDSPEKETEQVDTMNIENLDMEHEDEDELEL